MTLEPYALVSGQQDSAIAKCVTLGHVKVWFSYGEPIGFKVGEEPAIVLSGWCSPYHENRFRTVMARRHVEEVIHLTGCTKAVGRGRFNILYEELLARLSGTDVGAPPDVVADYLLDVGHIDAANMVRKMFGRCV